jgi:3-deoxy-manno-octulosonate cytidylyltransferase (CMP-KDO synthetase)
LTDPQLPSGTDRLAAVVEALQAEVVVNIQADEPLVCGGSVRAMVAALQADDSAGMATVGARFTSLSDYQDPNKVKVLVSQRARALWFSRSPMPHIRGCPGGLSEGAVATLPVYWHQGLYAYRRQTLLQWPQLPPSPLEQAECLEQLRALENGLHIAFAEAPEPAIGIDTAEDLERFEAQLPPLS